VATAIRNGDLELTDELLVAHMDDAIKPINASRRLKLPLSG
jgi:hypothetical protein